MKVLFAVNNEHISESIIKRYQQDYKEIISAKNVYYFNAIIKELQRDKTYDRIIVSEDLEPFSNNNYDAIDKFIFDKMDNISDEATNQSGNDIPIILICADRREKSEPLLVKLFGIGVYNALIGKDRSITTVCELLNRPRGKKEAKVYYRIDSEDVDYKVENEGDVSEAEIQNILNHYKNLGKNEEKYVESFDHIASQYTDAQLRLIAKFLPLNVKAVLEANSAKYQEAVSFGGAPNTKKVANNNYQSRNAKTERGQNNNQENYGGPKLDFIEKNLSQNRITEPVVIPTAINTNNVRRMNNEQAPIQQVREVKQPLPQETMQRQPANIDPQQFDDILGNIPTPVQTQEPQQVQPEEPLVAQPKRRGRPKKIQDETAVQDATPKRGRGRPKKVQEIDESIEQTSLDMPMSNAPVNLFELGEEDNEAPTEKPSGAYSDIVLPGLEEETEEQVASPVTNNVPYMDEPTGLEEMYNNQADSQPFGSNIIGGDNINPSTDYNANNNVNNDINSITNNNENSNINENINSNLNANNNQSIVGNIANNMDQMQEQAVPNVTPSFENQNTNAMQNTGNYEMSNNNLSGLVSANKKIVAFVGTSKNGTSFLVNNLAEMFSQKGIKTALLDLTQNRNAYYIYTENEEALRQTAFNAISNLRKGEAKGIQVNKNLSVYTTLPGYNEDINDYANILETLARNYSLILLDCDFETDYGYFKEAQEIYLVQSLDVLTIQPLTAFLRDLKAKNVLSPEKIRIALNKVVKVRTLTERTIIGGMAFYNDPAMSFMTELFNKDSVPYCSIPFEEQAYSKYLEGLVNCKISLNGYSKNFIAAFSKLANMVYPLIGNGNASKKKNYNNYASNNNYANNNFSSNMNETLNKMKNNY